MHQNNSADSNNALLLSIGAALINPSQYSSNRLPSDNQHVKKRRNDARPSKQHILRIEDLEITAPYFRVLCNDSKLVKRLADVW